MRVFLHPGAENDVEEAASLYEKTGSPALAAKFVAEFKRLSQFLLENPDIGAPRSHGRRSFSMSLFPYSVIYRPRADGIRVLVVKHDRRRPGHGGSRR
jgi:plasmid stabilization system protein ParE